MVKRSRTVQVLRGHADSKHRRTVQALRGHADSVNDVQWLAYSNILATASSDKTVSLWDARTGLATATFYSHTNSVNSVAAVSYTHLTLPTILLV